MFLDASAMVAILTLEDGHQTLASRLDVAQSPVTSAIAIYEATLAVSRKRRAEIETAGKEVETFLRRIGVSVLPISADTARLALGAQAAFGKPAGHNARLNMGDCFAYAMAKQHGVPLLYKGDDFAQTDLA